MSVAVRRDLIAFARRGLGERLGAAVTQSRSRPFAARPEGRRWAARGAVRVRGWVCRCSGAGSLARVRPIAPAHACVRG